ncbi:MAG TPA: hypothetical protein VMF59_00075, partial [Bacteroidota bacterium]|nr:hypothetical protein [Bacteroidota bacterium]
MPGLEVKEHTTPDEFKSLEPVWNELVGAMPGASLYVSFDWLWTWWECFGGGKRRLRILSVSEKGRTIAIAPFMEVGRRFLGIPYETVEFISARNYAFSHLTMSGLMDIIAPARAGEAARAILLHMLAGPSRWIHMRLEPLAEGGNVLARLAPVASGLGLRIREGETFEAYEASLSSGWEGRRLGGDGRQKDASVALEEKLRRHGEITWEDTDGSQSGESLFETILGVEKRSWKW